MIENYFESVAVAMTVCDKEGKVVYQNQRAISALGDARGANFQECHKPSSWEAIQQMLTQGNSNAYTIEKKGVKKLIYQTPWYQGGEVAGLVEYSIVLPEDMPHKIR
jgi:hypothetical protein